MATAAARTPEILPARPQLNLPREPWKFTNLQRVVDTLACTELCTTIGCLEAALPVVSGPQYVFHNGALAENLSGSAILAHGVTLHTTTTDDVLSRSLDALDTLPLTAGVTHTFKVTGKGKLPLHLIHVASGEPSTSRFRIELEAGAELTLIEHQVAAPHFTTWQNLSVEVVLAEGAILTHSVQQTLPATCVLSRRTFVKLADTATYTATTFQSGGTFSRIETHAELASNTSFRHIGLSLARREQHHDCTLHVHHTGTANSTHIRQRNLIDDKAHAVFQGKFHVDQAAQKTDAYMHCHNLLLNDTARASHKPELEIYADDVKCSHGAATGGLNANQLFYLEARGFMPAQATSLLTEGFVNEFIDEFPEVLQKNMGAALFAWQTNTVDTSDPTPDFGMDAIRRETNLPLTPEIIIES
ncbi:MAG: Fe-S cluster assembly protein SufD [Blastochloris viridis]|uniref:Fe-S cluster assembly protein SufD n=1 Tax=Blastochloris viridis TaxID=1079 RepID=A0A6N4R5J4_BLAVI|nr:MAG: Fe-S cluster assembly protein SufD [Blastochloris viridis]